MRLGVAPVICWVICHLMGVTGLAMQVFVVESALPVVSQVPVLSGAFGADEEYAATGACLSTLASFVTIPFDVGFGIKERPKGLSFRCFRCPLPSPE